MRCIIICYRSELRFSNVPQAIVAVPRGNRHQITESDVAGVSGVAV